MVKLARVQPDMARPKQEPHIAFLLCIDNSSSYLIGHPVIALLLPLKVWDPRSSSAIRTDDISNPCVPDDPSRAYHDITARRGG
jgi:hypothetical protein